MCGSVRQVGELPFREGNVQAWCKYAAVTDRGSVDSPVSPTWIRLLAAHCVSNRWQQANPALPLHRKRPWFAAGLLEDQRMHHFERASGYESHEVHGCSIQWRSTDLAWQLGGTHEQNSCSPIAQLWSSNVQTGTARSTIADDGIDPK
jgi:hypothetical protein